VTDPRPHCYRCDKPQATCICKTVPLLLNRTGATIVQHPRERRHPLGTARFAQLGLRDVRVLVDVEGRYRGDDAPLGFPEKTGILYPSSDAVPLPAGSSESAPEHLIVIDGTWHQAKTLYRDMAWLRKYPHYVLSPDAPSRYRIRREPELSYISTLEALLLAISQLEPELGGVEQLLLAFDAMIDHQIDYEKNSTSHRGRHPRRGGGFRRKPRALGEHFANLVLLYAETVLDIDAPRVVSQDPTRRKPPRVLAYFCAHRLRDDSTFERWVAKPGSSVPMGILDATSAHGRARPHEFVTPSDFQRDLATFLNPEDSFAAWGPSSLRWLPAAFKQPAGRAVLLKAAYGSVRPGQGSLEQIIERESLMTKPCPIPGRGGTRTSHARAVAEWINATS
jgi:DTW domain-containing protein